MKKFWNSPITWGQSITFGLIMGFISYIVTIMSFGYKLTEVWNVTCEAFKEYLDFRKEARSLIERNHEE